MRVFIKNKVVTLRGSSYAVDEAGNSVFKIKGKFFTFTHKKRIYDMAGNLLYTVRTRFFNFIIHKAFVCDKNGKKLAYVRNRMSFTRSFEIKGLDGTNLEIRGDILAFNMTVYLDGVPIGHIHRNFTIIRDSFILDAEPVNLPYLTAVVIAIDNVVDSAQGSNR